MEDKELKVMESRVRAAAEKCPTAKEVLKELWPDTFMSTMPTIKFQVGDIVKMRCFGIKQHGHLAKVLKAEQDGYDESYTIEFFEPGFGLNDRQPAKDGYGWYTGCNSLELVRRD